MAEVKNNIVTRGLSGLVGDQLVFRNRGGKTIVAVRPQERSGEPSESQKQNQTRFQEAILYGQSVLANSEVKAAYKAAASEGQSAYNVAVGDFMHAPDIKEIDISKYTGKIGDTIDVTVTDDFKVTAVSVTIYNADGSEVEHGQAIQQNIKSKWLYTATADNETLSGDKIVIRAFDLPGNIAQQDTELN